MKSIIVASQNPVKIKAAQVGFERMFPQQAFTFSGVSVPSGVSAQPMGDEETLQGALNRVQAARLHHPDVTYMVGIEGGCTDHADGSMSVYAWVVVQDANNRIGRGKTAVFYLPEEVVTLVRGGMELGHADDAVFGRSNSKQDNGAVGLLTDDAITRETYYVDAVILALIPFKNTGLTFK